MCLSHATPFLSFPPQQSRGLAAEQAQEEGMKEMSEVFKAAGAQVYVPANAE
jgi:hypothetical protein